MKKTILSGMKKERIPTNLKKDDEVIVISGAQKGKRGKILHIDRVREMVFVQGVNKKRRFQRPSQENPQGGSIEVEAGINISNVMYYDSKKKKGVRLGIKRNEAGNRIRITRPDGKEV
jgi:large subunit ribosomal protein L24